jgi:ferric-dicitrate binding protein FerR (iron transport regulator)
VSLQLKNLALNLNENIDDLIIKDLFGEISQKEKLDLESALSGDLELRQKKNILYKFWFNYFPKRINHQIIQKTESKLGFNNNPKSRFSTQQLLKIAASVVLIISLGYSVYHHFNKHTVVSLNEYVTLPGEVKEFVLSDGTKVWLNSKSVLIASEPFVDENREVLLIGEGYFEVAHNKEKPFIIKSPNLKTTVLGTHLNVSDYPAELITEVSLYEGKVELSDKNITENKMVMKPGEKVSFANDEKNFYIKSIELEKPAEWRDGILRFYDEDLNSISQKLERKFMTKILITDEEIGKLRFTASFDTEPLDKILKLLSEAHDFKTIKTTKGIIIKSNKNNI